MGKLLIGWAEEAITPDKPVYLQGQFYERISTHIETPVTATAMAIEQGDEVGILVSVDLIDFKEGVVSKAKEKISELLPDFDISKVMLFCTHTHTSIGTSGSEASPTSLILNEFLPKNKKYTSIVKHNKDVMDGDEAPDFVAEKIALAAFKAWNNKKPAYYANEFGRAAVGMNRRVVYDDGTAKMWGDVVTPNFVSLEGGNDSGIELLYLFDENKKLTGIIANVCCPAQILEQRSFVSADFWGEAKKYIREKLGDDIYLLSMCGAAGDQCPRDLVRWVEPETPILDPNISRNHYFKRKADPSMFDLKGCRLVGKRIANEVISVYEEIEEIKEEAIFKHESIKLDLPLRRVTISDYKNAVEQIEKYVDKNKDKEEFNYIDTAEMYVQAGTIARYREQQNKDFCTTEIHFIRIGDIAIASNPFELFLDYGNQMKARCEVEQLFVAQLTDTYIGYLPTEKAEKGGHYSAYVSSGKIGHEGGDILVRATVEHINKLFKD